MPYRFRDFELDPLRYQLRRAGAALPVRPQVFDLVLLLLRHRDRPVSKKEILATVWRGRAVTDASLTQAIARARRLLGDSPDDQSIIRTVRGRGYWWVAETEEEASSRPSAARRPFVGRDLESRALTNGLDEAQRGRGSVALIVGEAGAGKSGLAEHLAAQGKERGLHVLTARGEDLHPTPPFYLWRQIVRQVAEAGHALPTRVASFAWDDRPVLEQSSAVLDAETSLQSAAARAGLYQDLRSLMQSFAGRRPAVVILEDIHRADLASLQALLHIASFASQLSILLVATQRPSHLSADERTRTELANLSRVSSVDAMLLRPLSDADVESFLVELGDPRVPVAQARLVFSASRGNPFFLWQIVQIARFRAGLKNEADLAGLPTAVRAAIALQVRELPRDCFEAMRAAAVVGGSFDARVLSEMLERPLPAITRSLAVGDEAGLVRCKSPGRYDFVHSLLRDALYEGMDPTVRAETHMSAANALVRVYGSDSGDRLPAIAAHFKEARLIGGREQAANLLERCGASAQQKLAFSDAATFFADALGLIRDSDNRDPEAEIRLLLAIGTARLCAGDRESARAALLEAAGLATQSHRPQLLSDAVLRMSPSVLSLEAGVVDRKLIALLEKALGCLDEQEVALKVEVAGRLALALYWSDADSRRSQLGTFLRQVPIKHAQARMRGVLFALGASWGPDSLEERRVALDELHRRAISPGGLESVARVFRVATFLELGEIDAMQQEAALLEGELRSRGEAYGAWYSGMFEASRALMRGEFDYAVRLAQEYFEVGQRFGDANVSHAYGAQIAETLWLRGAASVALAGSEELAARYATMTEWQSIGIFFRALVGQRSEAESAIERLGASGFRSIRRNLGWTLAVCSLAEAVVRLRLTRWAPALYQLLAPYRGRNAVAGYGVISWGAISRFLGQLAGLMGRFDEGEALLEEAIRSDSRAGAASWLVRSELAMALLLNERDQGERGRQIANRVRMQAQALGALQIERDLAACGL